MILVLGIDGATWTVVRPNLGRLPTFQRLCEIGTSLDVVLTEAPLSPSIWCGMFSGKTLEEHHHDSFVVDGKIVRREDIEVDFIWDVLQKSGRKVYALNVPFVVPPYSFGTTFRPIGFGLPTSEREWQEELERVTEKTLELLGDRPDVLISIYTVLDRVQHFHWGADCVLDWYRKVDERLGEIVFQSGFVDDGDNRLVVISDHGFCSFGDAKVQTLPKETDEGTLKGDHHEIAMAITVGVSGEIARPQDLFSLIARESGLAA